MFMIKSRSMSWRFVCKLTLRDFAVASCRDDSRQLVNLPLRHLKLAKRCCNLYQFDEIALQRIVSTCTLEYHSPRKNGTPSIFLSEYNINS